MLVFIDESGDAGLKLGAGSGSHFVVALTVFNENKEALMADHHISKIRQNLGLRSDFELHFHKMSSRFKSVFLEEICQFDFNYFCVVINKAELVKEKLKLPGSFYKHACKLVCEDAKRHLKEATVVIDGSGSREFKKQLANYLKKNLNDRDAGIRCIKSVKMQESHKNNLLQLADMIAGTVGRSYKQRSDSEKYLEIIRAKEVSVRIWPC